MEREFCNRHQQWTDDVRGEQLCDSCLKESNESGPRMRCTPLVPSRELVEGHWKWVERMPE